MKPKNAAQLLNPESPLRYLLYFLLLLPAIMFRDYTPSNELKYLSIVEEALRDNTWFAFYNHGEIYADKPPLFLWLMMIARLVTGGFAAWINIGFFVLAPAVGILAVMDRWFAKVKLAHTPLVSNLLLLTSAMYLGSAIVLRMDMLMSFFIVLSLYSFFKLYAGMASRHDGWLLPVWIFLAIFTKGATGFLIPLVSIAGFLAFKKQLRTFGRYLGWKQWGILLGLCAVWFSLVYLEGGREYLNDILFRQTVGRGIDSFHHKQPVWFYFPRMLWSFAPWALFFLVLLWQGVRRKMLKTDAQQFFAVTAVVNIVMMSLISSKLDIYLIPIYPFVVYLCASLFAGIGNNAAVKISLCIPAAIVALLFPGALIFHAKIPADFTGILPYAAAALLSAGGVGALWMALKNKPAQAVISLAGGMMLTFCVGGFAIPQFNHLIGFEAMAKEAREKADAEQIDHYAYYKFYTAANMDVFLDRQLECLDSVAQLDSLDRLPRPSILFVRKREARREPDFGAWIQARQPEWQAGDYCWYIVGGKEAQE